MIINSLISFEYIETLEDLELLISEIESLSRDELIALDTEGYPDYSLSVRASALDPHTCKLRLISLYWLSRNMPVVVDALKVDCTSLIKALNPLPKVAHVAIFDMKLIRSNYGVWMSNFYCSHVAMCTLSVSSGWRVGQMRGHSLKDLARDYFSIHMDKELAKSDWSGELSEEQLAYSAIDVTSPSPNVRSVVIEGFTQIREACRELGQLYSFNLDQSCLPIIARMEFNGIAINTKVMDRMAGSVKDLLETNQLRLCKDLGLPIEQKLVSRAGQLVREIVVPDGVSRLLNNNKELVKLVSTSLRKSGVDIKDLKAETLENSIKEIEEGEEGDSVLSTSSITLINTLLAYKRYSRMYSESLKYIRMLNPVTEKLHSGIKVIGASTGRMSSSGLDKERLNIQQINTIAIDLEIEEEDLFL